MIILILKYYHTPMIILILNTTNTNTMIILITNTNTNTNSPLLHCFNSSITSKISTENRGDDDNPMFN